MTASAPRAFPSASGAQEVVRGSLAQLDGLSTEAIVAFVWQDQRPLRGMLGFLDWRLSGAVSALLQDGELDGHADEVVLMPVRGRVGQRRLFLFGLGALPGKPVPTAVSETVLTRWRDAQVVLRRAGATRVTILLPEVQVEDDASWREIDRRVMDVFRTRGGSVAATQIFGTS